MTDDDETPHEDFRHASTRHFRARAREMGAQDVARTTEQRTTGLAGIDARTMTRTEFENLKDQLRGGRRAGLGSEATNCAPSEIAWLGNPLKQE
jgi:hypothetical protein